MNKFLDKYDTLIFDMDGVVTSENGYWNAAALTVCEYLASKRYFGSDDIDTAALHNNVKAIRADIFCGDKLIVLLKGKGVNSNWDLGYVTVLISLIIGTNDAQAIYAYAEGIDCDIISAYDSLAKLASEKIGMAYADICRNGKLWCDMRDCFQEWYLGDDLFYESYGRYPNEQGKQGLYKTEEPIIPLCDLKAVLCELSKTKRLCIGTGRLSREIIPPLSGWGVIDRFSPDGLCTYDYVVTAEEKTGLTLTKPHPYMFLKALYGLGYNDESLISGDYDKAKISKTLVIGDAGADILAAKAMGADFCAVLTGVSGQSGRAYFEEQNAEFILNDIRELI